MVWIIFLDGRDGDWCLGENWVSSKLLWGFSGVRRVSITHTEFGSDYSWRGVRSGFWHRRHSTCRYRESGMRVKGVWHRVGFNRDRGGGIRGVWGVFAGEWGNSVWSYFDWRKLAVMAVFPMELSLLHRYAFGIKRRGDHPVSIYWSAVMD